MGEYLSTPATEKHTEEGENGRIRYGVVGMQGWRRTMEDSHIANLDIGDGTSLFAVFDGHGGSEVAKFVQKNFVKELKKLESFKKKDFRNCLQEIFMKMDQVMLTKEGQKELSKFQGQQLQGNENSNTGELSEKSFAGCTACVILITKTEIYCANAGDSRCVLSKKIKAKDLSTDHKPDLPSEKHRIERAHGYVEEARVNGMLALSRSLGDFEYKSNPIMKPQDQIVIAFPDVTIEKITNETDFLILACDGIWDCLTSQQAVTLVADKLKKTKGKQGLSVLVGEMFDQILAKDLASSNGIGTDNMTCIVIEFKK